MANFVLVFYKDPGGDTPDEKTMAAWGAWFKGMGENVVDAGAPFNDNGLAVEKSGTNPVENHAAGGYSIVKADSVEAAAKMAEDCPVLDAPGGAVRVYEAMPM